MCDVVCDLDLTHNSASVKAWAGTVSDTARIVPRRILPMPSDPGAPITIIVSAAELTLLEKLDFPCLHHVLATARRTEEGIALEGSWADLDSLAGWVAGEANHARRNRRPRQTELLDSIADQLEDVLAAHRR